MVHLEEVHNFFWGLTLENEKRYSQTVKTGFHISMAALEPINDKKGSPAVCVMIQAADGEFLLCTLNTESTPQQQLDLNFMENEQITFFLSGKGRVHLTGYIVPEEEEAEEEESGEEEEADSEEFETDPGSGSEDEDVPQLQALEDSDSDSEEEATAGGKRKKKQRDKQVKKKLLLEEAEDAHSDDDEEDEDDDENDIMDINELLASVDDSSDDEDDDYDEDGEELEDIEEEDSDGDSSGEDTEGSFLAKPQKKSKETESASKKKKSDKKKVKENAVETPKSENKKKKHKKGKVNSVEESPVPVTSASEPDTPATDKKKRKKKKNKNKNQENDIADSPKQDGKNSTEGKKSPGGGAENTPKPKRMTLQGGIIAEDVKEGHGPQATPGKMTAVHYVGRLHQNNKEFDRTHGTPFKFKLGKGEVIKGWDIGVKGMKVGGKRKLTIPAKMGYGSSRTGSIPANSTLVFEVELKSVS